MRKVSFVLKVGIVGMPNAGKSTLYNTLSEGEAIVAPYPFSTVEPNKAMIRVSDSDFDKLGRAVDARSLKYSYIQLWDIAGLIEGASEGNGLGNEFLGQVKNCDLLLHVIRLNAETVTEDAKRRVQIINQEIALFDHRLLLKPFEKARRHKRIFPKDADVQQQSDAFTKAYYGTRDGSAIREVIYETDFNLFQEIGLVSLKPQILIANTDGSIHANNLANRLSADVSINAEEVGQLMELSPEDQVELGYRSDEAQITINMLITAILKAAHMKQVYTIGHLGAGQWVVPQSANAVYCASELHGEMETEVSKVRVASFDNFIRFKSWSSVNSEGKSRVYNAEKYIPSDKEVLLFE